MDIYKDHGNIDSKMTDTCYYKILGVEKTATDKDIKKAYKKMAVKWHPDKNPDNKEVAEEKFKEIAEAYSVLSDPEQRKIYDQYGREGMKAGVGGGGGPQGGQYHFNFAQGQDPYDIFRQFFGTGGFNEFNEDGFGFNMHQGGFNQTRMHREKGPTMTLHLGCTLEELYSGNERKLKITRNITDSNGSRRTEEKMITVNILPGWKEGTKITFENCGDETPGIAPGDLIVVIKQKDHPVFTRDDNNLVMKKRIGIIEAMTGFDMTVDTLDGRKRKLRVSEVPNSDHSFVVSNWGMTIRKKGRTMGYGDLVIKFTIDIPKLSPANREKIKDIIQ